MMKYEDILKVVRFYSNSASCDQELLSRALENLSKTSDLERLTVATEGCKYFHVQLEWSQTEKEEILVIAESKEDAIAKVRATWPDQSRGPKYVNCYHELRLFDTTP